MNWTDYWYNTSEYNAVDSSKEKGRKILLHDTTLRDGEQTPGVVFNEEDKIRIGVALSEFGVHRIEIMPVVSDDDFRAAKTLVDMKLRAEIVGFCRAVQADVDKCLEAGIKSAVIEIQTYPGVLSVLGWSTEEALGKIIDATNYARNNGMRVTVFFPLAPQLTFDYLKNVMTKVITEGSADSIVVPDTFGVLSPEGTFRLVTKIREFTDLPLEVHPHNSLGLATANALAGIRAGASVVHTCVNALGESAGNVPLEEIALDLLLLMGIDVGVKYTKTVELCRLVESLSNLPLFGNKPLAGSRSSAIEAGISIAMDSKMQKMGLIDFAKLYPTIVGNKREYVIGKKSGKASIEHKLSTLGMPPLSDDVIANILESVKNKAVGQKAPIADEQFKKIVEECIGAGKR
jgi:isopropylmalate/homocitrate/citramalate synthase